MSLVEIELSFASASGLIDRLPLHETAEVPGHWFTETTPRYTHLIIAHKAELADRLLGSFSGVDRIGLQ